MKREEFKDYFAFSKKEKRGISVLLFLILLVSVMQFLIPFFIPKKEIQIQILSELINTLNTEVNENEIDERDFHHKNKFKSNQEENYLPYARDTSFYFKSKKDYPEKPKYTWTKLAIDLNSCDTTEIKKIRGIGSYTAKRIIETREKLGGFYSFQQLTEFKFIKPEIIDSIKVHCIVDKEKIRYLSINTISDTTSKFSSILTSQECKTVLSYRRNHGAFQNCSDLKKVLIISDEKIEKLCPYLSFDQ